MIAIYFIYLRSIKLKFAPPRHVATRTRMNSLQTLERVRDDMNNTKHWLDRKWLSAEALSHMGTRLIAYAEELKKAKEERLAELAANGPQVHFEHGELNITLLRDGAEKFYNFAEFMVEVVRTDSAEVRKDFKLEGPAAEDGWTYFIRANPTDYGQLPFGIYVSEEEAKLLKKRIRAAEDAEFGDEHP